MPRRGCGLDIFLEITEREREKYETGRDVLIYEFCMNLFNPHAFHVLSQLNPCDGF
jgi:hypothetical protein